MRQANDHARVSPEGKKLGSLMSRIAASECANLARNGEQDERCKTCAFRDGTVPNGCLQTQLDVTKAICEDVPFMCHQTPGICFGWFAVRRVADRRESAIGEKLSPCKWEFSAPDQVQP